MARKKVYKEISVFGSIFDIFNHFGFILFTLACIFPFYYLFINTISDNELVARGVINFLPQGIHVKTILP